MAEHLQPIGVYYEGVVDDTKAVVDGCSGKAETASTFDTRRSWQLPPSQVGNENTVMSHDDEMSYIIQCTNIKQ